MKRVVLTALAFVFFSLGAATTAVAQEEAVAQQGTISQSFLLAVRLGNVAQFEEAYLRHVEWHRQQSDPWTWDMWSTVTGDLGTYIVITDGHTWAEFDAPPVDPVADGADAMAQFGSLVESITGGFARSMTDVSRPAAGRMPLARVAHSGQVEGPVRSKWKGRFGASGTSSERSDAGVDLSGRSRIGEWGVGLVSSHRGTFQSDTVSVMHEAVEDSVTEGGITDDVVPVFDGQLAGDEGRTTAVAVIEDLEEISALGVVERHHSEVIKG